MKRFWNMLRGRPVNDEEDENEHVEHNQENQGNQNENDALMNDEVAADQQAAPMMDGVNLDDLTPEELAAAQTQVLQFLRQRMGLDNQNNEGNDEAAEGHEQADGAAPNNLGDAFLAYLAGLVPNAATPASSNHSMKSPQDILNQELYDAARQGDLERLKSLHSRGGDLHFKRICKSSNQNRLNNQEPKIKTPLHVACSKGHVDVVEWLLKQDPTVIDDVSPDLKRGALHYAANRKSHPKIISLLLDAGMDVNSKSLNDWTPLHYAACEARLDMCQVLYEYNVDLHAEMGGGGNALTLAACSKNEELTKWLIDKGVSPNVQDKQGLTPLHRLARFGDLSMTKIFVEYGHADINILDNSGCSIMEEADRHNMSEIATYLWTKGCESQSIKNPDGLGPTAWIRLRHINMPKSRYGAGLAVVGNKMVMFAGLGLESDEHNHDNENHMSDEQRTSLLKDTHVADLSKVEFMSMLPAVGQLDNNKTTSTSSKSSEANASSNNSLTIASNAHAHLTLNPARKGKFIALDDDLLGGRSIDHLNDPVLSKERLTASIVTSNHPFKRSEKFGYFEVHVLDAGENRILTVGLVDDNYPANNKQPGWEKDSYGYHGDDGGCFHNNGAGKPWGERFNPGDVIGCGINFESSEVFFVKNGKFLGVSYYGIKADQYWPTVGVENRGALFRVNFGAKPFLFNFVVPTITWTKCPTQEDFGCSHGRLVPLPEVDEVLAIPPKIIALSLKVWLFNLRSNRWRSHDCIGTRPLVLAGSQHVRLGDAVFIWNSSKSDSEDPTSIPHRVPTALYRLDLDSWVWTELLSYDPEKDDTIDDNLCKIEIEEESDDSDSSDSDSDDDDDTRKQAKEKRSKSKSQATLTSTATSNAPKQTANKEPEEEQNNNKEGQSKLTPKQEMSVRVHNVVTLLDSEFKDSFVVAMEDEHELAFVNNKMRMLRFNPNDWRYSVHDLKGTRPSITHHSAVSVGSDIVTFGGWDDRKQQNELFILDTTQNLWYKPHIVGLLFPRPRNNHASVYFETHDPRFAMDSAEEAEESEMGSNSIIAPFTKKKKKSNSTNETQSSSSTSDSITSSSSSKRLLKSSLANLRTSMRLQLTSNPSLANRPLYRFLIMAMGWNGANTMYDFDFVALDTQKRPEELSLLLEGSALSSQPKLAQVGGSSSKFDPIVSDNSGVPFDICFKILDNSSSMAVDPKEGDGPGFVSNSDGNFVMAHRSILWARSEYFRKMFDCADSEAPSFVVIHDASSTHFNALLRFLYTDHVNVVSLLDDYRGFVRVAEKYAPEHVTRLVAEHLHTKVYEPERLNEQLGELLESGKFSDVEFKVIDVDENGMERCEIFKAHKAVICPRSLYFKALLTGGLMESHLGQITIEDTSPVEFKAMLTWLYSKQIDYNSIGDYILPLFSLVCRCDLRKLKSILEGVISFNLDASNVASLLIMSEQLNAPHLEQAAVSFILKEFTTSAATCSIQYEEENTKQEVMRIINSRHSKSLAKLGIQKFQI